jgi:IclR family transcriptional regulator, acetate operon repressor
LIADLAAGSLFAIVNAVQPTEHDARQERHGGTDTPSGAPVPAVAMACRILEALAELRPAGATLSELGRRLELSKSSMHGQLTTLVASGFVERDELTRKFRLGPALVRLGRAAATEPDAAALTAERLPVLAGEHHVTFAMATVTAPDEARLVDCAYPHRAVHVGLELGSRYGVFDGVIGKCLLAALEPAAAEAAVLAVPIPRHTAKTIDDPATLLADVALVRARGWGSSAGELKENHAVAAPLIGEDGRPELILCAVGFPSELPEEDFGAVGTALLETTRAIEVALGRAPAHDYDTQEAR